MISINTVVIKSMLISVFIIGVFAGTVIAESNDTESGASTLSAGTSYSYVNYGSDTHDYYKFYLYNGDSASVQFYNTCDIDMVEVTVKQKNDGNTGGGWMQANLDCSESITWSPLRMSNGEAKLKTTSIDGWGGDSAKVRIIITINDDNRNRDYDGYIDDNDDCVSTSGYSYQDRNGCPDYDGDGWSDYGDDCPWDSSEYLDTDDDGYCDGDDDFPNDDTQWEDNDDDGYGDNSDGNQGDHFPNDRTQWFDNDGDGFGDNSDGNNPDHCRFVEGYSNQDRNGCPDSDWDGWSDPDASNLAHPDGTADAFMNEYDEWQDTDRDSYGDNMDRCPNVAGTSAYRILTGTEIAAAGPLGFEHELWQVMGISDSMVNEMYSTILAQKGDLRGAISPDSIGSNLYDELPFSLGKDSAQYWIYWRGCTDTDGDGFEDGSDEFINNPTQWADADGDGFGDNLAHPTITSHSIEQCRATITTQIQGGNINYNRGSDAMLCVIYGAENNHITLQDEEYRCNDGDMIPIRWVNDGDDDCGDMSDEGVTMKVSEFKPASRYYHFSDYDIGWAIPSATNGDDCPLESGTSIHDRKGCLDSDGDGWSDATEDWKIEDGADAFPEDKTQYIDSDGDGFGDDENGGTDLADAFPSNPTQWKDTDGDGWGDNQDPAASKVDSHINESSQWADRDKDSFGDNISGVNGDFCPDSYGASIVDRYGCPDSDSDGYSDMNGFFATTTDKAGNGDAGAIFTLAVVPFLLIIILVVFQLSRKNKGRELDRGDIQEAAYQSATATTPAPAPIQSRPPPAKVEQGASSWVEQYDNQGNMYYFNQDTQESSWDTPKE